MVSVLALVLVVVRWRGCCHRRSSTGGVEGSFTEPRCGADRSRTTADVDTL